MSALAWLSGFLDGEGHVSVHGSTVSGDKRWYQASIGIRNTHAPTVKLIESLLDQYGINYGTLFEERSKANKNHKDSYWINLTGMPNLLKFIELVYPYSFTKHEQLGLMMEWCESRISNKGAYTGYSEREMEIVEIFKTINKRGT